MVRFAFPFLLERERERPRPPSEAVRLEAALDGVRGLRADFVQIRQISLTGETVEARGFLAFRAPSDFRLAFSTPDPQELVIQGDSLWVVMPEENQAQRYPFLVDAPGSEVFLLFGAKSRKLEDVFEVAQESWGDHEAALLLTPSNKEPGYPIEEIRLILDRRGFPERLFLREATGDTIVFRFTRIVTNPEGLAGLVELQTSSRDRGHRRLAPVPRDRSPHRSRPLIRNARRRPAQV